MVLSYKYRHNGGEWESVEEPIPILRVACRFGGTRPYFICPGVVNGITCGRRVTKLYGPGRYFLCRHCYQLAYQSQREQPCWRAQRRACKLWRRLGRNSDDNFIPRPKGMHERTYQNLLARAPQILTEGTDWRFLNEIKRELKA